MHPRFLHDRFRPTLAAASAFALAVSGLLAAPALAERLEVTAGYNFLATTPGSHTTVSFPRGFFGEVNGVPSDAIADRTISLEGRPVGPLGFSPASSVEVASGNCHSGGGHYHCHKATENFALTDTISRVSAATLQNVGDSASVTLQIVALSLQTPSSAPVVVTYGGQNPRSFTAVLTLDPGKTQPVGSIEFHRTSAKGGTMIVEMPVEFQVVFLGPGGARFGPVKLSTVLSSDDNGFTIKGN